MAKHCIFCCDEIKNRDFTVHKRCNFYCHTHCYTFVKSNPKCCQACFPTGRVHNDLFVRHPGYSTKIRHLEAEVAKLKKKDELKARPIVLAARDNNYGNNLNQLWVVQARQQNHGFNRNQLPGAQARHPHRVNNPNQLWGAQQHHVVNRNQLPGAQARQPHRGNNHNQLWRAQAKQQNHGNNRSQLPGPQARQPHHVNNGKQLHGAQVRQQNHGNNRNQFLKAQARQHRPANDGKLVLKLAPEQPHCDNAILNRTMNCVVFPNAPNKKPRILKIKLHR